MAHLPTPRKSSLTSRVVSLLGSLNLIGPQRKSSHPHTVDLGGDEHSRLQRRLDNRDGRDHTFLSLIRRKRHQTSQLNQRLNEHRSYYQLWQKLVVATALGTSLGVLTWANLFIQEKVTFAGVPYRIVQKFWNDKPARDAYFASDRQALHNRLKALGIETDIKDYYRDRFTSEYELDRYIHQIMFDRTGYVGEAYNVNNFGQLSAIEY